MKEKRTFQPIAAGLLAVMLIFFGWTYPAGAEDKKPLFIADFSRQADVAAGEDFYSWMEESGWRRGFGAPRFFFIRDGQLRMVSKPGPIYKDRYKLALLDRKKLIKGIENKVLVRITPEGFRIDPGTDPLLRFVFTPLDLPEPEADLRDPDKNDAALYLLVFFDSTAREFEGYEIPMSLAYVWANREWAKPVASDPDYAEFMRYMSVGAGGEAVGRQQTISRPIVGDFRRAFPEFEHVPAIIGLGLMIDSNTLGGTAESALSSIEIVMRPDPEDPAGGTPASSRRDPTSPPPAS
jgi:hypothetical protein